MSDDTIRRAVGEYLECLDDLTNGSSQAYFSSLYTNRPGAWHAMVRNLRYGLHHFPPGTIADMCCGDGLQAYVFTRHGRSVLGVDSDGPRIELARRAADKLGVEIEYRHADVKEEILNIQAGAVWMHRAIGHIRGLDGYLANCHQALAPNGALVLITSNRATRRWIPGVRRGQYSVAEMSTKLEKQGFDVEDVRHHGFLSAAPDRFLPRGADRIEDWLSTVPVLKRMAGSFSITGYVR